MSSRLSARWSLRRCPICLIPSCQLSWDSPTLRCPDIFIPIFGACLGSSPAPASTSWIFPTRCGRDTGLGPAAEMSDEWEAWGKMRMGMIPVIISYPLLRAHWYNSIISVSNWLHPWQYPLASPLEPYLIFSHDETLRFRTRFTISTRKNLGLPKDAVKTIKFSSLENIRGARIGHGGRGIADQHMASARGSQHHCYRASGVWCWYNE